MGAAENYKAFVKFIARLIITYEVFPEWVLLSGRTICL